MSDTSESLFSDSLDSLEFDSFIFQSQVGESNSSETTDELIPDSQNSPNGTRVTEHLSDVEDFDIMSAPDLEDSSDIADPMSPSEGDSPSEIEEVDSMVFRGFTNLKKCIYDQPGYLAETEEWAIYRRDRGFKGKVTICGPFLITELNRLVPYMEGNLVKFHPLNMPHVKIGKIEIIGYVISALQDAKFYMYKVEDGTGAMTIYQEVKNFHEDAKQRQQIDERYNKYAKKITEKSLQNAKVHPKRFPNPRPKFMYPTDTKLRDMAILEHNWSIETDNGLLGKKIERHDYVHAMGYCTLEFPFKKKPQDEITYEDLSLAKLNFFATKVNCIQEEEYNRKFLTWVTTVIDKRYNGHPDISELTFDSVNEEEEGPEEQEEPEEIIRVIDTPSENFEM